jgi:hypothetical protein
VTTAAYQPDDCRCDYGTRTHATGSGHRRGCPAHQRWLDNGRTWRPAVAEDACRFTAEAREIVARLSDRTGEMYDSEAEFIIDLTERFAQYGDRTFITTAQINWLRSLKERYR